MIKMIYMSGLNLLYERTDAFCASFKIPPDLPIEFVVMEQPTTIDKSTLDAIKRRVWNGLLPVTIRMADETICSFPLHVSHSPSLWKEMDLVHVGLDSCV